MYAGRVTCCPLVSNVEYALPPITIKKTPRVPVRFEKKMDGRTDGHQIDTLRLSLDVAIA